jgi:hypothetical protein
MKILVLHVPLLNIESNAVSFVKPILNYYVKSGRNGDQTQCDSSKNYIVNGKNVIYKRPSRGGWYVVDERAVLVR